MSVGAPTVPAALPVALVQPGAFLVWLENPFKTMQQKVDGFRPDWILTGA